MKKKDEYQIMLKFYQYMKKEKGIVLTENDKEELKKLIREAYIKGHIDGYNECFKEDE